MFENKVIQDNKILISNLKARMFRGYHQIAKKSKSLINEKNINLNSIYTPQRKEKDKIDPYLKTYTNRFPTKINREIFPFENDYQEIYKNKYLNKYNNLILNNDIQITNISKNKTQNKMKNTKNKNIYLTESKNSNHRSKNNTDSNKKQIMNLLFPYKEEINQFSNLPFFSLTKNPYSTEIDLNNMKTVGENTLKNLLQEDFLYKISHKKENESKYINNNFIKNKGVKRGKTIPFNENNKYNKNKLKLKLDVQNINENKNIYLNSKEKRYKILEKEMEPLKNIVSLFKDFENNILTEENFNKEIGNNNLIKDVKINQTENENNNLKIKVITEKNLDENFDEGYHTAYNFKKPLFYPVNYYSSNQLKAKEKKYEKSHKLAFEEFQKKINLKEEKILKNNRKNYELDEYEKQYFNKLFSKKIITNKLAFMRECRIRDIILTNKLKCEFSPSDIKRLLNGLKPWNDCAKLDEKFLKKKLPKSTDEFKYN